MLHAGATEPAQPILRAQTGAVEEGPAGKEVCRVLVCACGHFKKCFPLENKVDLYLCQHHDYLEMLPSFCCHKTSLK